MTIYHQQKLLIICIIVSSDSFILNIIILSIADRKKIL